MSLIGIRSVRYGNEEKKNADAGSIQVLEYIDVKLGMWWGHLSTLHSTILYFYGNFWPKSKDFVLKLSKIPTFLSSDLSTIHFCTYRPEKGFFYSYQKNLRISSNLSVSTMFFCTFQPEAKACTCIHVSVWRNWDQTLQELISDLMHTNRLLSKEILESTW